MRRMISALLMSLATVANAAEKMQIPPLPKGVVLSNQAIGDSKPVKFDFQGASVAQVIGLVYGEALKQPYVIEPTVLKDERLVSFRFDTSSGDLRRFWRDFLDALGFTIDARNGVDFVTAKRAEEKVSPDVDVFVYRPQYRPLSYLADMLSPLFKTGSFTVMRAVRAPASAKVEIGTKTAPPPSGSAAATIDQDSDTLIFQGTADEIAKLKKLLPQVDTAIGEVVIKAVVYEVATGQSDGSAFSLALSLLGGKIGMNLGDTATLANSARLRLASIDTAISALAGDSRFKAVSTPRLRVKSGAQARLSVGQDVPTLGAVTFPQGGGQPVQSVEYRSSGVILGLSPVVRESGIDLMVDQQISDFVKTETGVNNSPTLTKRSLTTTVSVADGELVVLGGLTQDKRSESTSGLSFLPKVLQSSSNIDSRTEVLVLLQVTKIAVSE